MKDGIEQEERRGTVREEGEKSGDGVHRWTPSPPVFPERLRPRDWIYAIGATVGILALVPLSLYTDGPLKGLGFYDSRVGYWDSAPSIALLIAFGGAAVWEPSVRQLVPKILAVGLVGAVAVMQLQAWLHPEPTVRNALLVIGIPAGTYVAYQVVEFRKLMRALDERDTEERRKGEKK